MQRTAGNLLLDFLFLPQHLLLAPSSSFTGKMYVVEEAVFSKHVFSKILEAQALLTKNNPVVGEMPQK